MLSTTAASGMFSKHSHNDKLMLFELELAIVSHLGAQYRTYKDVPVQP